MSNNKIPSGNVILLFTDIEGSTKLAQAHPEKLSSALEIHNEILKNAIESNNGHIFKIVGDAYCCAFENAGDAVKAAVEIQNNLAKEKWDEAVITVRIGIHSGNAEWNGHDYYGYMTLARASRVMSVAYGEQILVSNDAYVKLDLVNPVPGKEAGEISFRDLGERRLKDVIEPIRLYQVLSKDLREDFPPLKTLDARPNNLPVQLTSFIGREKEMKYAKELLMNSRLLTIAGTGGAGKTRFSLQMGADLVDDFANGVWLIELAELNDPFLLTQSFLDCFGIKEEQDKTPEQTLTDFLKHKEILIILDNCEHLIRACAVLAERLLLQCPRLKIITTSREALNCAGEQIYRIPALTLPHPRSKDTPDQLTQYESVRLFIERALAVNPEFKVTNENAPALAEVCSRLDGIPLAIELAAARTKVLSVEKIHKRLNDRFGLLKGGTRTALPRQQTLRALFDWSYELLTEKEKILWSRLSVFSCGLTLEAAEAICSDETIRKNCIIDLLTGLSEKSIIIFDESKERYRLLESIKQYGREKLKNKNEIFSKHLDYFLELSQTAKPELKGSNVKLWLNIFEADHNNFLSAIEWGVENEEAEKGGMIADAFWKYWEISGQYSSGIRILEIILNKKGDLSETTRVKLLNKVGNLYKFQGNYEVAGKFFEESLSISQKMKDKIGISASFINLGSLAFTQGDFEQAKKFFEESIAIKRDLGDKIGIAGSLNNLGGISFSQGEYKQAKEYYESSLAIRKEIGDKIGIAASLNNLGGLELYQGNYEQAKKLFEESLSIKKEVGDKKGIAYTLGYVGSVSNQQGDYEQTKKIYEESLSILKEIGDKQGIADFLNNLGNLASSQSNYEEARKFYEKSLNAFREIDARLGIASSLNNLGETLSFLGNCLGAKESLEESLTIFREIGDKHGIADSMNNLGKLSFYRGNYGMAVILFSVSEKIMESIGGVLDKVRQTGKDETLAKLHEHLSEEEFNKFWEEGKKLTLEEAVELALRRDDNA